MKLQYTQYQLSDEHHHASMPIEKTASYEPQGNTSEGQNQELQIEFNIKSTGS